MGWGYGWVGVVATLLVLAGCKKAEGVSCHGMDECGEGLACVGDPVRRCEKCAASPKCTKLGAMCELENGQCVRELGTEQVTEDTTDNKEGCPCGCDHSAARVAEVERLGGEAARNGIRNALETIAEREQAGYITEAMVQHRLRLLALRAKLDGAARYMRSHDSVRDVHALPTVENARLRVRHELIVHGETTEIVKGRAKPLRACFVWWLQLHNQTTDELALDPPAVAADVPFPVSRWYEDGGDGQPWDGVLAPRATKAVLVIGYLGEPVAPGTEIHATMPLEGLAIAATAEAYTRWDQARPRRQLELQ